MAHRAEFLPSSWGTWAELPTQGFGPGLEVRPHGQMGNEPMGGSCVYVFLCVCWGVYVRFVVMWYMYVHCVSMGVLCTPT